MKRSGCPEPTWPNGLPRWRPSRLRLLQSLKGTSLNLKTFLPLFVKYNVSGEFPSYYSHRYLHEKALGRDDLKRSTRKTAAT